jgi:hypothetical protein
VQCTSELCRLGDNEVRFILQAFLISGSAASAEPARSRFKSSIRSSVFRAI